MRVDARSRCALVYYTSCTFSGLELAVFRDAYGEVHALDAYCPHLGANLAVGGKVKGKCLECPFHAWRFNGEDGRCTHIPNARKSKTPILSDMLNQATDVFRYSTVKLAEFAAQILDFYSKIDNE